MAYWMSAFVSISCKGHLWSFNKALNSLIQDAHTLVNISHLFLPHKRHSHHKTSSKRDAVGVKMAESRCVCHAKQEESWKGGKLRAEGRFKCFFFKKRKKKKKRRKWEKSTKCFFTRPGCHRVTNLTVDDSSPLSSSALPPPSATLAPAAPQEPIALNTVNPFHGLSNPTTSRHRWHRMRCRNDKKRGNKKSTKNRLPIRVPLSFSNVRPQHDS